MSKTKNLFIQGLKEIFKSRRLEPQGKAVCVGKDHIGNKYFEAYVPNSPRKRQRYFERAELGSATDIVDLAKTPPAWDAWLRFRRDEPPSDEEVAESEEYFNVQQSMSKVKEESERSSDPPTNESEVGKALPKKRPFPKLELEK